MNGKIAFTFLAIFCLVQGFQAHTVHQYEQRNPITDIINAIKNAVDNIIENITNIIGDIPNLLDNLKKKIEEIIDQIDISAIITGIQDKIDGILAQAGIDVSEARGCIDAQKASVNALVDETKSKLLTCQQDADDQVAKLNQESEQLKVKADALVDDIVTRIDKCVKDNGINVINTVKCLGEQFAYLKVTAGALIDQAKETAHVAKETAVQVPIILGKCVLDVNGNILSKEKAIIDDFRTCLAEINQH